MDDTDTGMDRRWLAVMSTNAAAQTPILRTNHVNNGLLKRWEKNRISRLLQNIVGRDGIWVRNKKNKIEIGLRTTTAQNYHFGVVKESNTTLKVRGGWWSYYEGGERTQANLSDGDVGTITSFDDLTAELTATDQGVVYLELDQSQDPPTLEAVYATDSDWSTLDKHEYIKHKIIAVVNWNVGESIISSLKQDWRGGNILCVDNDNYHFEVVKSSSTSVKVRGGWWGFYHDGERFQADLDDENGGTVTAYTDLTNTITVGAGIIYLTLDRTSESEPTLKATFTEGALPADARNVFHKVLATCSVVGEDVSVKQDWNGGNILSTTKNDLDVLYDNFSIDEVHHDQLDEEVLQLKGWDSATSSTPAGGALFPYQPSGGGTLQYSDLDTIIAHIAMDFDSINFNTGGEVQLFEWKNAVPVPDYAVTDKDLVAIKQYNAGSVNAADSYYDDLGYCSIAELLTGGGGPFWELGEDYVKCYGTSIGVDASTLVIDLTNRELENGEWTVKDTTGAGDGAGGLLLDGGMYAAKGVYADRGDASWAGYFTDTTYLARLGGVSYAGRFSDTNTFADLCDGTRAGTFNDGTRTLVAADGTYAANAYGEINTDTAYRVAETKVVGVQGDAVDDATGAGDVVAQLNALLKELRASTGHGLIA